MHHRKGGFLHGLKRLGRGKKRSGHGKHGGHHDGLSKGKSHKKMQRHHFFQSELDEFKKGGKKVLDYEGRTDVKASVDLDRCKLCGKCESVCPAEAISVDEKNIHIDVNRCIGCGHCVERCKTGALSLVENKKTAVS